jgi:hypothetical protein
LNELVNVGVVLEPLDDERGTMMVAVPLHIVQNQGACSSFLNGRVGSMSIQGINYTTQQGVSAKIKACRIIVVSAKLNKTYQVISYQSLHSGIIEKTSNYL